MRPFKYMFIACAVLALSACNVTTPSQVKTGDIRLKDDTKTAVLDPAHLDPAAIDAIADDFKNNATDGSALRVLVSYPAGEPLSEISAKKQGDAIKAAFAKKGILKSAVDYVATEDKASAGRAVVSYRAVTAEAPAGCRKITGYNGSDELSDVKEYGFGCEIKTMMGKMVASPNDLLGKGGTPDDDSRRQGAMMEKYKSGKANEKMNGINASKVGN